MREKGYLFDVQNYSVNDGDGIRTTIFFAGCRLRCRWCSNPESFTTFDKVTHFSGSCVSCGRCAAACPRGCGIDLNEPENRKKCRSCGLCVAACPTGSRRSRIMTRTVAEVAAIVEKQEIFFRSSGGGVTYSGGEPTLQAGFLRALSETFHDRGLHQAMETCGCFDFDSVRDILERLDLIFMDVKLMDARAHRYFTGLDNALILENVARTGALRRVVRVPVIVGVNADEANIRDTARFVARHSKVPEMELLPYHEFGREKYEALGLPSPPSSFRTPSDEDLARLEEVVRAEGVAVVRYR